MPWESFLNLISDASFEKKLDIVLTNVQDHPFVSLFLFISFVHSFISFTINKILYSHEYYIGVELDAYNRTHIDSGLYIFVLSCIAAGQANSSSGTAMALIVLAFMILLEWDVVVVFHLKRLRDDP